MELKPFMMALATLLIPKVFAALSPTTCMSDCGDALAVTRDLFGCHKASSYCDCNPHGRTSFVPECLVATCNGYDVVAAAYASYLKRCPFSIWWSERPNFDAWVPTPFYDDYKKRSQLSRLASEGPRPRFYPNDGIPGWWNPLFSHDDGPVKRGLTDVIPANPLISATTQTNVHTVTVLPAASAILSTVTDISAQTYTQTLADAASAVPLSAISILTSALTSSQSAASAPGTTAYSQPISAAATSGTTSCNSSTLASLASAPMTSLIIPATATGLAIPTTAQVPAPIVSAIGNCTACSTTIVTVQSSSSTATCTTTLTVTAALASSTTPAVSEVIPTGGAVPTGEVSKVGLFMAWGVYAYYLHALG